MSTDKTNIPALPAETILRLVRDNVQGNTLRLTRDVGPYEVTEPTPDFLRLVGAIEAEVRAALSTPAAQEAETLEPAMLTALRLAWSGQHDRAANYVELAAQRLDTDGETSKARWLRTALAEMQGKQEPTMIYALGAAQEVRQEPVAPQGWRDMLVRVQAILNRIHVDVLLNDQMPAPGLVSARKDVAAMLAAPQPPQPVALTADPAVPYTYASTQATKCAGCGEYKHTPLRIDAMGGYVCLTCIDQKLGTLLGEFGYPAPQEPLTDERFSEEWHSQTGRIMGTDKAILLQAKLVTERAHGIKGD